MEISLADLLTMEPALVPTTSDGNRDLGNASSFATTVTWAVTARTTSPHLPLLRGGELVMIPNRVIDEIGDEIPALLREASLRDVSAVVVAKHHPQGYRTYPVSNGVPVLGWMTELTADTETVINRLLTECRGNLYRIGTELEREMADAATNQTGLESLLDTLLRSSGMPIFVEDATGRRVAASPGAGAAEPSDEPPDEMAGVERGLPSGDTLVLGPLRPEQRVIARFLVDRIATAVAAAIQRDRVARPRGSRRDEAIAQLLTDRPRGASEQRATALALALDPDAVYFVAVSRQSSEKELARALSNLGTLHPAGGGKDSRLTLVAVRGSPEAENLAGRVLDVKRRWAGHQIRPDASLALSAPAFGVAGLLGAAREARFVASMQSQAQFPRRAASFDSLDDVGAMRLLYQLRESSELRQFILEALGSLETNDRRGTLRMTLRAFLDSGGSQVDASHRLGIHRNTLAYRLRRIGEIVGRDVGDPGSWLTLHLALRASEMLDLDAHES